jgi:hypothetical protein
VSFGAGIAARRITYVSSGQLDAAIRIGRWAARGDRAVTVTNPDGQSGMATACFTVN